MLMLPLSGNLRATCATASTGRAPSLHLPVSIVYRVGNNSNKTDDLYADMQVLANTYQQSESTIPTAGMIP